jgi:hypothetical protein
MSGAIVQSKWWTITSLSWNNGGVKRNAASTGSGASTVSPNTRTSSRPTNAGRPAPVGVSVL